jgi:hypothetical protein
VEISVVSIIEALTIGGEALEIGANLDHGFARARAGVTAFPAISCGRR